MKTTAMGVILDPAEEQKCFLDDLMARYCAAGVPTAGGSWAFSRLLDGWETQDAREAVQIKFILNSRQASGAVRDAAETVSSQRKLVKLNHANARKKVEFTQKRLDKAKSPIKRARLQRRLEKEQRKATRWQQHIDAGTIPTVVFGTKELFVQRCRGNISREEWRDARSNRYVSGGDKEKGGNLNTRIVVISGQTHLEIAADAVQKGRTVRYNRVTVPIYIAHKPSKKTGQINGLNYRKMVLDYLKTGGAYQVEILRRNGRYHVHVTIDEEMPEPYNAHCGALGVDTNPDGLGVGWADYPGRLGIDTEAVPKPLVVRSSKNVEDFQFFSNWKQRSAIKRASIAAIKKITGKEVKSLVSWQHDRKNVLKAG